MVPVTTNQVISIFHWLDVGEAVVKSYIFSSYPTTTEASKKHLLHCRFPHSCWLRINASHNIAQRTRSTSSCPKLLFGSRTRFLLGFTFLVVPNKTCSLLLLGGYLDHLAHPVERRWFLDSCPWPTLIYSDLIVRSLQFTKCLVDYI